MYSKIEIIGAERGYTVTEDGIFLNPKNKEIGTRGKLPYIYTNIKVNGKLFKLYVHRLQAYQKFGDLIYKDNAVVRHLDGNSLNNPKCNIELGSQSDNMMDVDKEIRIKRSSEAFKKYSDEEVLEMRRLRNSGLSYKEIMEKFNISSKGTLNYILTKRILNKPN